MVAGAFVVFVLTLTASASELQWRPAGTKAKKQATVPARQSWTQKGNSERHVDSAIKLVGFEDDGGPLLPVAADQSPMRSVVVETDDAGAAFRSAQLTGASTDNELGTPFDDSPDLPPMNPVEDLELQEPPTTDDQNLLQQQQRQPATGFQPRATPGRIAPDPSAVEFQPSQEIAPVPTPLPTNVPPASASTLETERQKAEAACSQGFDDLRAKTVDRLSLVIAVTGDEGSDFPFECSIDDGTWHSGRCWEQTTYLWKASALCHKPLYFEDEQLERYGHSWSPLCQPFMSGAHFFSHLPVLPYCMGVEPPSECIYALGHYRPGSCAPYMCNPIPISPRGALFQAGAVVGTAAFLP